MCMLHCCGRHFSTLLNMETTIFAYTSLRILFEATVNLMVIHDQIMRFRCCVYVGFNLINRGSYLSAHVLLNLLHE